MSERWAVNASPLILLAKINHQHLLSQLADEIVMPIGVVTEINAGPPSDPGQRFLATAPFPFVAVDLVPEVLAWDLGAGESEVLSYAFLHSGWKAVVDDGAARRCAKALAIPCIGTLGVIIRARQKGLIKAAAPLLKTLQVQGFRIDERMIRDVLRQTVDESWD